jgi:hypothetical protein
MASRKPDKDRDWGTSVATRVGMDLLIEILKLAVIFSYL